MNAPKRNDEMQEALSRLTATLAAGLEGPYEAGREGNSATLADSIYYGDKRIAGALVEVASALREIAAALSSGRRSAP